MRRVPYVDFPAQFAASRDEILGVVERVFAAGQFVGGTEVEALEGELAELIGVRHCVGLASGTDALIIAMRALGIGPGDEVITPPNSFFASTSSIVEVGATPVFADVCEDGNIDPAAVGAAVTPRTAAIMPVHLSGRIADMNPLREIAEKHGLAIVEDAAQSIGSRYDGRMSGAFGKVGCFSAHPLKNLNAAGDAGFLTTDDDKIAEFARRYRNVGLADRNTVVEWGRVARLDTLQAAILRLRLKGLDAVIERRRANAEAYRRLITAKAVTLPVCRPIEFNTFHVFMIQAERRDDLQAFLTERGVETAVHYPVPIHLQPVCKDLGYGPGSMPVCEALAGRILSLPIHQYLSDDDIAHVAASIGAFYGEG